MIYTAAEFHRVDSADAYRALVENVMAARRASGRIEAATWIDPTFVEAYISAANWVVNCTCGAGNMVQPDWSLACCLACGAIRTNIVVPADRVAIEAALNARPQEYSRNWKPPETVESLLADNVAHGIG